MTQIAIIEYGMGNVQSVKNALDALGCSSWVTSTPSSLAEADRIILPGVGAFGDGMRRLKERGFLPALKEEVLTKGKPFLGICLGMQLLGTTGSEFGRFEGLNWIPGTVERLAPGEQNLRIPHIGWNDLTMVRPSALFQHLPAQSSFYFVHSFHLATAEPASVVRQCSYGQIFAAAVQKDNIFGVQFHPEKSHKHGLKVLENFAKLDVRERCHDQNAADPVSSFEEWPFGSE